MEHPAGKRDRWSHIPPGRDGGSKRSDKEMFLYRGVEQLVARWAHNPKVGGSNPLPATKRKGIADLAIPFLILVEDSTMPI